MLKFDAFDKRFAYEVLLLIKFDVTSLVVLKGWNFNRKWGILKVTHSYCVFKPKSVPWYTTLEGKFSTEVKQLG